MNEKVNYPFILMIVLLTSIVWLTGFYVFARPAGENVIENKTQSPILFYTYSSGFGFTEENNKKYQALLYWDKDSDENYLDVYSESSEPIYRLNGNFINEFIPESKIYSSKSIKWSPTNKYMLIQDNAIQTTVYESSTGKEIIKLQNVSEGHPTPFWLSEDTLVYAYQTIGNQQTDPINNRGWGFGHAQGISFVNLNVENPVITNLYNPTLTVDYSFDSESCKSTINYCPDLKIIKMTVDNTDGWNTSENIVEEIIDLDI